ncbi:tyrosine-type recombinase/integrase [Roseibacterium sp. SDUM158016]|uniref:tyrosine-type recombinase/integrase n=1 Tax=Roseicyclus sediminis TaxID=2980997 RepID=UPI0021D3950C|nr:tyrosine-type recombinase/integrase [Roseibacterium sp. SDUM158016]MCU4653739.1 tyrosine-type recombinase/integrase [Roseibacterium sp. SDUM158016]
MFDTTSPPWQEPAHQTLADLIASYRASSRYTCLRARTRRDYDQVLDYLKGTIGQVAVASIKRPQVIAQMEANAHRTRFANYVQQVLSVLFEHAIDLGWLDHNPAKSVRKLKTPAERRAPHRPWTDAAIAIFRARANATARLIFELGIGSVQRPGDWPKFRWSDYDGEALRITQGKTGISLWLPCSQELKRMLDATRRHGVSILSDADGRPFSYFKMARIMREERKRLGLVEFDLHALRYRGVQELAWAGCTDDEIAAFSGHASIAMIRKYAGEARQVMRARTAAQKRQMLTETRTN